MAVYAQDYGYFFNSDSSDRTYDADSFEEWLKPFFTNGVFNGDLEVTAQATPNMSVKVAAGRAFIDGKLGRWTAANTLNIATAPGSYSRIDTIVLRNDRTNRRISLEVVTGTASANPQPTAPTRTNDVYELVIAQITVETGVTEITSSKIFDTRTDETLCGWVTATVDQVDFDQFKEQFDGWAEDQAEAFEDWFEEIRGQLDEDAAGHLQNEIDAINSEITNISGALGNTVKVTAQSLSATEQVQAKTNIGIVYSANQPANPVTGMIWLKPGS